MKADIIGFESIPLHNNFLKLSKSKYNEMFKQVSS
jgi:hypothetical protein